MIEVATLGGKPPNRWKKIPMNELVTTQQQETRLAINKDTKELIRSSVAPNTIEAYRKATERLESWLLVSC